MGTHTGAGTPKDAAAHEGPRLEQEKSKKGRKRGRKE